MAATQPKHYHTKVCFVLRSRRKFSLFDLFLRYQKMAKPKISRKLDKQEPTKKPPFVMAEPNDDAAAFGWDMSKLRYPSKDSTKTDVWPGRSIFEAAEAKELAEQYGFNIDFVNAKFVQVVLDNSADVRAAAEKCAAAKYSDESLAALRRAILHEFKETVIPQMQERFKKVAGLVADFYAARIAHLMTFGPQEN